MSNQSSEKKSIRYLSVAFATGIGDGLIIPFALLAGASRIVNASATVVLFVFAFTILAALLMGAANYFTRKKEYYEHYTPREVKKQHARKFYANLDLPIAIQEQSVDDTIKENEVWDQLSKPALTESASLAATITGGSYLVGGLIAMAPFFFIPASMVALKISMIVTGSLLLVIGFVKNRERRYPIIGAAWMLLLGALAAGAAYWIAPFIFA